MRLPGSLLANLRADCLLFRSMTLDDVPVVMSIEKAAYKYCWTEGIFRDCLRVGYDCWVVTDPSGTWIVGYGILSYAVGEAHVLNVCAHPALRRRGIGRLVLRYLVDKARRLGADTVLLEVRPSNEAAIQLYSSMGFNEVGIRRNYYRADKGKEDALILALTLLNGHQ